MWQVERGHCFAEIVECMSAFQFLSRTVAGYVQGMNDVASVVLLVLKDDETTAFWCFVKVMERMVSLHVEANYFNVLRSMSMLCSNFVPLSEVLSSLSAISTGICPPSILVLHALA